MFFPPLKILQEIGQTLSHYNDLIENYQKQIKLLEVATQCLYKEGSLTLISQDMKTQGCDCAEESLDLLLLDVMMGA